MLAVYGEILADMIGKEQNGTLAYERYAGGAPFNVACACTRAGGKAGFTGCVGDDIIGRYLVEFSREQGLELADISVLPDVNTTLAFVELSADGERSFCFYRKGTADYKLQQHTLAYIKDADIVHLGSLMLSEPEGVAFADKAVDAVKKAGKKLSFDINYRNDIFPDGRVAKKIYAKYAEAADIVKYSEEELEMFTGMKGIDGINKLSRSDKLVCVTLGGNGSVYAIGGRVRTVPSIKVKPVDTTGAGDAFYGALLSKLDGKDFAALSDSELYDIFRFANVAGALATTARGALNSLPAKEEIEKYLN
ncbi:carbohydrate kinase family protein [Pumilibacter intestinalis]|uniref:carbohydrate kinase family protein n=1 Tax=Pumilibacter intestinalis TaxID=2941511 RepID=UPI00203E85C1|nr:carbohydrate kinase [Pumilibacter intestinalis]